MWPFVTLAAVVIVGLGVGASVGAKYFLVPPEPTISTEEVTGVTEAPDPPGAPTALEIQVITPGEGTEAGVARISWEPPEGVTADEYYQVRWKDVPDNYPAEYSAWEAVHGHNSTAKKIPPQLPEQCVEVRTVNPNGPVSGVETVCLPEE